MSREGRKLRPYDVDVKGDERFEEAYKLMFDEGYTVSNSITSNRMLQEGLDNPSAL